MSEQHHNLKTLPKFFKAIEDGTKTFEVRFNDRNYQKFDILHLREFIPPDTYTGREITREVIYVLDDPEYCKAGYVVMGLKK